MFTEYAIYYLQVNFNKYCIKEDRESQKYIGFVCDKLWNVSSDGS